MTTYDQAGLAYDSPTVAYDGETVTTFSVPGAPPRIRGLPRVVVAIDGATLPVQDYSFTSVINGGDHEFRAEAPLRRLLALDAGQEAPLTVYHEETGDVLWDGSFVTDPEIREGVGLISATGTKAEMEKAHGRLLFQSRDMSKWFDRAGPPLLNAETQILGLQHDQGSFIWRENQASPANTGDHRSMGFWSPDSPIQRLAFNHRTAFASDRQYEIWATNAWPADSGYTLLATYPEAPSWARDTLPFGTSYKGILIQRKYVGGAATYSEGYGQVWDVRVNGIAPGDTYTASQVLAHLAALMGYNSSLIEPSALNVLPLDWIDGSRADLATYMAAVQNWRWAARTMATPGTGLVHYLEAGPWPIEEDVTLFRSGAEPNLASQQRRNEGVVHYRDVSGSDAEARVRADPDPLKKYEVVRTIEVRLPDVQPDGSLATHVARTLANAHARKRWTGDMNVAISRDRAGRGDARLLRPGMVAQLGDWAPAQDTLHHIHGVEQTQTGVRVSIEAPISEAPLVEPARLERLRHPSAPDLPELPLPEPTEPYVSPFPSEAEQHAAREAILGGRGTPLRPGAKGHEGKQPGRDWY